MSPPPPPSSSPPPRHLPTLLLFLPPPPWAAARCRRRRRRRRRRPPRRSCGGSARRAAPPPSPRRYRSISDVMRRSLPVDAAPRGARLRGTRCDVCGPGSGTRSCCCATAATAAATPSASAPSPPGSPPAPGSARHAPRAPSPSKVRRRACRHARSRPFPSFSNFSPPFSFLSCFGLFLSHCFSPCVFGGVGGVRVPDDSDEDR